MRKLTNIFYLVCAFVALFQQQMSILNAQGFSPSLQGPGAVYFYLDEPGDLEVTLTMRNLDNPSRVYANAYAWLLSPDRELLTEWSLIDQRVTGSKELVQRGHTWKGENLAAGIYMLLVETTGYTGTDWNIAWGIETNAAQYVISRGESPGGRGNTPIRWRSQSEPLQMIFEALPANSQIEIKNLNDHKPTLTLRDSQDQILIERELSPGKNRFSVSSSADHGLWQLNLSPGDYILSIENFTRWKTWAGFGYEKHPYWSFTREQFFNYRLAQWVPFPRFLTVEEQSESPLQFQIHNPSSHEVMKVKATFSEPTDIFFFEEDQITLQPEETKPITILRNSNNHSVINSPIQIQFTIESPISLTTYASLRPSTGEDKKLTVPFILKPFQHERRLLGYNPHYPLNEVHFDLSNNPWIRDGRDRYRSQGVFTRDGQTDWRLDEFESALKEAIPGFSMTFMGGSFMPTRTSFDEQGGIYTVLSAMDKSKRSTESRAVLLFKPNREANWQSYVLSEPGFTIGDIEFFTGHNSHKNPPPVVLYTKEDDPGLAWGYRNRIELHIPKRNGDQLEISRKFILSKNAISLCTHSGGASTLASTDNKIFVVWGEVVEGPEAKVHPGVPIYISCYDRDTDTLSQPLRIGFAPPINDMHNSPGITLDSEGYLHVVLGAHSKHPFYYLRSLAPNDIHSGWTAPEAIARTGLKAHGTGPSESGAQTYVGLVTDAEDTLHLVFRHDLQDMAGPFPGFNERSRALSYQRRPKGGEWSQATPLIIPAFPGYSVYYHKLTVDRKGRLFLYHTYRSANSNYRSDLPGAEDYPAIWVSEDQGTTWRLASDKDL